MSSIGSTRRVTRAASRVSSSGGSTPVIPEVSARSLRSGSVARSTAGSSAASVARTVMGSVTGSIVGSVAGSSRRTVLPSTTRAVNTAYGVRGQTDYAHDIATAGIDRGLEGIENVVGEALTENLDGLTRDARQLSMIEEEGSIGGDRTQTQHGARMNFVGAQDGGAGANHTGTRNPTALEEDPRTYSLERGLTPTTSISPKSWTLFDVLTWLGVLLVVLLVADIYRGPLLGDKYDFVRSRSSPLQVSNNSTLSTSTEVKLLARRFDKLEHQMRNLPSIPCMTNINEPKVHKINWFAPGLGALAAPAMSSPTKIMTRSYGQVSSEDAVPVVQRSSWFSSSLTSWFPHPGSKSSSSNGNLVTKKHKYNIGEYREIEEALLPWHDVGDCWCAPSSRGKLQLAVNLPRFVSPTELVVEHVPQGELWDIGNAPKEVELWVQVLDYELRENIAMAILKKFPDIYKSTTQRGKGRTTVKTLGDTFVPIGRWTYDINAANHIQTFTVPVDLSNWKTATRRVVVRANSNWGSADVTCLYRLKLHGQDMEGSVVYNDLEEVSVLDQLYD